MTPVLVAIIALIAAIDCEIEHGIIIWYFQKHLRKYNY